MTSPMEWTIFASIVLSLLFIDLYVGHRKKHVVSIKESLRWTGFWVLFAIAFGISVYYIYGEQKALEFFTGYLLEESLSVDNLFVFLLIFRYFNIPQQYQYNVLFWGIIGSLVLRAIFIFVGVAVISQFYWVIYIFGFFLIYAAIKMVTSKDKEIQPENSRILRATRKVIPLTHEFHGTNFFIMKDKKYHATPLFVVVAMLMLMDAMFAVDSIPAIISITKDQFIIYTSNVFAVMGLRSLFFSLSGMMRAFHYLRYGLSIVLFYVGAKILISSFYQISTLFSFGVIVSIISASIIYSVFSTKKMQEQDSRAKEEELYNTYSDE